MNNLQSFRNAMLADGITPPDEIPEDGREVRFPGDGKGRRNTAGYCRWYGDHGKYGDHSRAFFRIWPPKSGTAVDTDDPGNTAAATATAIYNKAIQATPDHPYLKKKGIQHHLALTTDQGELFIPIISADYYIRSAQFIDQEGGKRFLKDGQKKGHFALVGKLDESPVIICEGWATGMSLREATGEGIVCALDAGNLAAVAQAIREVCPNHEIIVAADDDYQTKGNPGLTKATEAARLVNGLVAVPKFGDDRPEGATDFNDLAQQRGGHAVLHCIQAAAPPPAGPPILAYSDPLGAARIFAGSSDPLRYWQGMFYRWRDNAYRPDPLDDIKSKIYPFLEASQIRDKSDLHPYRPNRNRVGEVLDALKSAVNLEDYHTPPCWIGGGDNAADYLAVKNGLLHIPERNLCKSDSRYFVLNALPFDFLPDAGNPIEWLTFLNSLWADDQQAIDTLQEIMGLLLTNDTTLQKIFMLVGPMRSGKGTVARIITAMLGQANVAGPTLAGLSQQFGLATLIGKRAAVISDARLGSRADQSAITERLLSISGEDSLSVPRKFLPDFTGKLDVRFLILSNELPRLADSSGALATRFVMLTMQRSFLGKEDCGLTKRLMGELPAILNWSLDGLDRLRCRGYFVQPESSKGAMQELADLTSPISAFLRDRTTQGPGYAVEIKLLYQAWCSWCVEQGREYPGNLQSFGRDLRAAVPSIKIKQHRTADKHVRMYEGLTL